MNRQNQYRIDPEMARLIAEYDPDDDPSKGPYGTRLAEMVAEVAGFNPSHYGEAYRSILSQVRNTKRESRIREEVTPEERARGVLRRLPELDSNERRTKRELITFLSRARKLGANVPSYSDALKMSREELWGAIVVVKYDARKEARTYCPEVLDEIDAINQRQIANKSLLR